MEIISKTLQEETDSLFLLKIETFTVIVHSKMNIIMVFMFFLGLDAFTCYLNYLTYH